MWIGTAGWSIPRASAYRFGDEGTHLQRYARSFGCVEINSSFHRPHARLIYARWAETTPKDFQFAVKMPRSVTHDGRLVRPAEALERFLGETEGLGSKRGPILVQLPPSLTFESRVAARFFDCLRKRYEGPVVCEPRHVSWASPAADRMFVRHCVARVAADPPHAPAFALPGGWDGLVYLRLHGSPRTYWSSYSPAYLESLASAMRDWKAPAWCVFDNTASGAAVENAWSLRRLAHPASAPDAQSSERR